MKFGVLDHIDDGGLPVGQQFEERLALIERYEQAGFHAYHLAEHHGTPLGPRGRRRASSSPPPRSARRRCASGRSSTACRCTTRCGSSRRSACSTTSATDGCSSASAPACRRSRSGSSSVDWDSRRERFDETFEILLKGLASDELTHDGPDHHYDAVPMALRPVQQPHPPLWFGISHAGRAEWVAEHEVNVVALLPAVMVRPITDAYRAAWEARGRAPEDIPFMGVSRLIVVADTDDEAMSVARRAYRRWFESINLLWRKYEVPSPRRRAARGFRRLARRRRGLRRHARQGDRVRRRPGGGGRDQLLLRRPRLRRHHVRRGLADGRAVRERRHPGVRPGRGEVARYSRACVSSRARPSASPMRRVSSWRCRVELVRLLAGGAGSGDVAVQRNAFEFQPLRFEGRLRRAACGRQGPRSRRPGWPGRPRRRRGRGRFSPASRARMCSAARRMRSRRERRLEIHRPQRLEPGGRGRQALSQEVALGAARGVERRLRSGGRRCGAPLPPFAAAARRVAAPCASHEATSAGASSVRSATRPMSSSRIALAGRSRETGPQRRDDRVLALGAREVGAGQLALDAEAHERHRRLDAAAIARAPSAATRSAGSLPAGSGTTRSSSLRRAATRAPRSIASCPAASASSASSTVGARRASSPTCSSVIAVPISPTVLRSPAWCIAMTSV